jgi:hypothetical protein
MSYGTLISTVTVGAGGAASIVFGSGGTIPQTFTDLLLVLSGRTSDGTGAYQTVTLSINGSTANQSERYIYTTGSSTTGTTYSQVELWASGNGSSANIFGNMQLYIPNYFGSATKPMSWDVTADNNGSSCIQVVGAGLWSNTSPITSLTLNANFVQNSTASLYGIK